MDRGEINRGIGLALMAYTLWGLSPIFWRLGDGSAGSWRGSIQVRVGPSWSVMPGVTAKAIDPIGAGRSTRRSW